jgi:hypothetical protein
MSIFDDHNKGGLFMYAYDFKPTHNGIDHGLIFVAMPYDNKYDFIFEDLITPATTSASKKLPLPLRSVRVKDDIRTTSGWINVLEHLSVAQVVMGVLTGNNQNVFYELGIAHATQQISRQILIANEGYEPSFDTKDLIYLKYNDKKISESVEPLADKILEAIRDYDSKKDMEVKKARGALGVSAFCAILQFGKRRNFPVHAAELLELELKDKAPYRDGLDILCQQGLLFLNTAIQEGPQPIQFSYWWTGVGNDVLNLLDIINDDELSERRATQYNSDLRFLL